MGVVEVSPGVLGCLMVTLIATYTPPPHTHKLAFISLQAIYRYTDLAVIGHQKIPNIMNIDLVLGMSGGLSITRYR